MKIPATWDGETVYIVAFDTRNPATAVLIRHDGSFAFAELTSLTVLRHEGVFNSYGRDNTFTPPAETIASLARRQAFKEAGE